MDVVKDYIEYENTGLYDLGDIFSKLVDGYISMGLVNRDSYVDIGQLYLACQEYVTSTYATNETPCVKKINIEKDLAAMKLEIGPCDDNSVAFHLVSRYSALGLVEYTDYAKIGQIYSEIFKHIANKDEKIQKPDVNDLEKHIKPTMLVKVDRPSNPFDFEQYLEKVRLDFEKRNMGYNISVHGSDISISVMSGMYY